MAKVIAFILCLGALVVTAANAGEHSGRGAYSDALQWYFEAAEAGNAQAQFLLGLKYETGTDVERDLAQAANWFEKSARQGNLEAQFKYAALLEGGRGRVADPVAAAQWYDRAARKGFAPAQYNLGVMQVNAASTDAERIDGLAWLMKARDQGMVPATEFLATIEELWPAELVETAKRRVAEDTGSGGKRRP